MADHNIAHSFSKMADRIPERTALIASTRAGHRNWSFGLLLRATNGFAHALTERGVRPNDRVMLMVTPSPEFVALTFALFKIGAVIILIDPGMGYRNLQRCIGQVRPTAFIGIFKAHLFRAISPRPFSTVKIKICIGFSCGIFGRGLTAAGMLQDRYTKKGAFTAAARGKDDLAAILFTTGSTGPPKGVCYTHGVFQAQLKLIRDYYRITPDDIDQPAFPLFALFSAALGACSVIPDMDAARPASVDPEKFIRTILEHNVTYSFGSPAIWNVVSRYCRQQKISLPSIRKILMAGAPVPGDLIERIKSILEPDAEIHTPYGATESLPVSSITGTEILNETWKQTMQGKGACVGKPLPGIDIRIIPISDDPIARWDNSLVLPAGQSGEIVVRGDVVTRAYDNNEKENRLAKIQDTADGSAWHRMGDIGYLDETGRLWFCGRKGHRVTTASGPLFTICCEAIFNQHPAVFRSALVGVGPAGDQTPVLIVEPFEPVKDQKKLFAELKDLGQGHDHTRAIENFLIHPAFPVDIRHNAKIFREKLAVWAETQRT